jgi:formate-dependent nitrite reductase membrane component NrfD
MTEQLVAEIISLIKDSKEFVVGQAPSVIQQMLAYGAWDAKFAMWVFGIAVAIGLILIFTDIVLWGNSAGVIIGCFIVIVCGICMAYNFSTLKKIEIAPKVYLLEQLANMAKPSSK